MNKKIINLIVIFILITILPIIGTDLVGREVYKNIFNPLLFISIGIYCFFLVKEEDKKYNFNTRSIREMAIVGGLIYIIIYYLSGLLIGYSDSPFNHTFIPIIKNLYAFLVIAIGQEIIRSSFIKRDNNKKNINNIWIVTIILIIYEIITLNNFTFFNSFSNLLTFMVKDLLPILISNIFLTYLTYREGLISSLLYKIPFVIIYVLTPIFPTNNYAVLCVIQAIVPLIIYLKLEKDYFSHLDIFIKEGISKGDKYRFALFVGLLAVVISFASGSLGVAPVVIVSGSMEPIIKRGDVVVYKKIDYKEIEIGDIIVYNLNSIRVVHRVISFKNSSNGEILLVTKGDNNSYKDSNPVKKSQLVGKLLFIIPKMGYPTIWFNEITNSSNGNVGVETGD